MTLGGRSSRRTTPQLHPSSSTGAARCPVRPLGGLAGVRLAGKMRGEASPGGCGDGACEGRIGGRGGGGRGGERGRGWACGGGQGRQQRQRPCLPAGRARERFEAETGN